MLEIDVVLAESYDETNNLFTATQTVRVCLEHSLVSLSKWESIWEIPFISDGDKTHDQYISYIRLMIVGPEPTPEVFSRIVEKHMDDIVTYINAKRSATKIHSASKGSGGKMVVTSELIYYWMVTAQIPAQYETWHLNRLLTLIRLINAKNSPKKKMTLAERRNLNRKRQAEYNTRG